MLAKCQHCQGLCTIPIVYGKPSAEVLRAACRGLVELSGCVLDARSPNVRCLECGQSSGSALASTNDAATLAELRVIVRRHRNAIFTGMVSAGLFSIAGSGTSSISDYLRLRDLAGVDGALDEGHVQNVRQFAFDHPEEFAALIAEAEAQIAILALRGRHRVHDGMFAAAASLMLGSPLAQKDYGAEDMERYWDWLRSGNLHFEG